MNRIIRKTVSVVMVIVLAFGVFAVNPFASESVIAVKTDRESYLQGETVTAEVYFPSAYGEIASLDLVLIFDTSKLEIVSVNSGAELDKALNEQTNGKVFSEGHSIPGFIRWGLAGSNNFSFRGTFAVVKFKVKAKALSGETELKLRVDNAANSGYVNKTSSVTVGKTAFEIVTVGANELAFELADDKKGYDVVAYSCKTVDNVSVPATYAGLPVTGIAGNVFSGHSELKKIVLPDTIRYIGDYAFKDCISLSNITIKNPVDTIGVGAFSGCTALTDITLPVGIEVLKSNLFSGCDSLANVIIPFTVTTIKQNAFKDCTSLENVKISKNTTDIDDNAFSGCGNVTFKTVSANTYLPEYILQKFPAAKISLIKDITLGTATVTENVQYTGKALYPAVSVTLDSGETFKRTDYSVVYRNNTEIGKALVYVVGNGMDGYGEGYILKFNIVCNHNYQKTIGKAADCTNDGYYNCKCTVCGNQTTETIKALGHNESEWIIDVRPTIFTTGLKHNTCTFCKNTVNENIVIPKAYPDINNDKSINSADGLMILMYAVGIDDVITTQDMMLNADTNGDGYINSADALTVLQISIGQIEI